MEEYTSDEIRSELTTAVSNGASSEEIARLTSQLRQAEVREERQRQDYGDAPSAGTDETPTESAVLVDATGTAPVFHALYQDDDGNTTRAERGQLVVVDGALRFQKIEATEGGDGS